MGRYLYPRILAFIFLVCIIGVTEPAAGQEDGCFPASCGGSGPTIRFPFRLKDRHPEHCGYPSPGFELSCSATNTTEVEIQYPVQASARNILIPLRVKIRVNNINYVSQQIDFSPIDHDCLPKQLPFGEFQPNSSISPPFKMSQGYSYEYTLFNCSLNNNNKNDSGTYSRYGNPVPCLGGQGYQVLAFGSFYSTSEFTLSSCSKLYNISNVPSDLFDDRSIIQWFKPSCGQCEAKGQECRLKKNTIDAAETECIDIATQPPKGST